MLRPSNELQRAVVLLEQALRPRASSQAIPERLVLEAASIASSELLGDIEGRKSA